MPPPTPGLSGAQTGCRESPDPGLAPAGAAHHGRGLLALPGHGQPPPPGRRAGRGRARSRPRPLDRCQVMMIMMMMMMMVMMIVMIRLPQYDSSEEKESQEPATGETRKHIGLLGWTIGNR